MKALMVPCRRALRGAAEVRDAREDFVALGFVFFLPLVVALIALSR